MTHANMRAGVALPPGNPPLPADAVKMDANRNGLIERTEATGATAEHFNLFDENGSGVLNGAELIRGPVNDVYLPSTTYRDRHTVTLAGKRVMMVHLGVAHSDDSSVLYFPDERAVFSADIMQVKRLPQNITPTVGAYIDALRTIMALDFEHAATGSWVLRFGFGGFLLNRWHLDCRVRPSCSAVRARTEAADSCTSSVPGDECSEKERTMKALAFALVLMTFPYSASAADPFVGTYKFNPAKSATSGGQMPPELTLTISEDGSNLLITTSGKTASGSPISADVLIVPKTGGTLKAPEGERNYDSTIVSRRDANTIDMVALQKGKERTRVTLALSRDGKTLTRSFTSTNAQGRPVNGTSVLERE